MKRVILAIATSAILLGAGFAQAADVIVGLVDMPRVLNGTKAGKRAGGELQKLFNQRKETLTAEDKKLKEMAAAFEKDKLVLSAKQKETRMKELQGRAAAFQKAAAEADREVQQKKQEYESKAYPQIQAIVTELAKDKKLALVLDKASPSLIYADYVDLTEEVIKRHDAKHGG
jgi:outer membrane protein